MTSTTFVTNDINLKQNTRDPYAPDWLGFWKFLGAIVSIVVAFVSFGMIETGVNKTILETGNLVDNTGSLLLEFETYSIYAPLLTGVLALVVGTILLFNIALTSDGFSSADFMVAFYGFVILIIAAGALYSSYSANSAHEIPGETVAKLMASHADGQALASEGNEARVYVADYGVSAFAVDHVNTSNGISTFVITPTNP